MSKISPAVGIPALFSSDVTKHLMDGQVAVTDVTLSDVADSSFESTSSFKYDLAGSGLKSSQQVNTDFSKFQNHTFFNSAEANVNTSFDKLINKFPFDGSKKEIEAFELSLTGFERFVLNRFPKNVGYLRFSGSSTTDASLGTYISVKDFAGVTISNLSKNESGESIIDPGKKSITIEMQVYIPTSSNGNQVLCQKYNRSGSRPLANDHGFTLALSQSSTTTDCNVIFGLASGSGNFLSASAKIQKGSFQHLVACYDRSSGVNKAKIFINEKLSGESSHASTFGDLNFKTVNFTVGSGSSHTSIASNKTTQAAESSEGADDGAKVTYPTTWNDFIPTETFHGAIDELRVFHSVRSIKEQQLFSKKNLDSNKDVVLYFKFNEPTGSFGINDVIIDYSGNALHSKISNFNGTLRNTGSANTSDWPDQPLKYERLNSNPILFPAFDDVLNLNIELLNSASEYDSKNPNLITNLVPQHYFLDGGIFEGFDDAGGNLDHPISGSGIPGSATIGSPQMLTALLYTWAKFFDEIKVYLDSFSNYTFVNYESDDSIPDSFLLNKLSQHGFYVPSFFASANKEQFFEGENISHSISNNPISLQGVQNQIWRRILVNIQEIIRSKGTIHGIKAYLRAVGINPDSNMRVREYGGSTTGKISRLRQPKSKISAMLDFSGTLCPVNNEEQSSHSSSSFDRTHPKRPFFRSVFLSGSRIEPGLPFTQGFLVDNSAGTRPGAGKVPSTGISNNPDDGLFTSGSFTYEAVYKFPHSRSLLMAQTQSLMRVFVSGSDPGHAGNPGNIAFRNHALLVNLVAISGSSLVSSSVNLFARTNWGPEKKRITLAGPLGVDIDKWRPPVLRMSVTGVNIFDGDKWNVSFGRERGDLINIQTSSSWFLRVGKNNFGKITQEAMTSSLFSGEPLSGSDNLATAQGAQTPQAVKYFNFFQNVTATFNHGCYIAIGSQSLYKQSEAEDIHGPALDIGLVGSKVQGEKRLRNDHEVLQSRHTHFDGMVGQMRFWSKGLTTDEWREHVRNFKSIGVIDPTVNFNFINNQSGSFERLRLDYSMDQVVTKSNSSGEIVIFDYTQNKAEPHFRPWNEPTKGNSGYTKTTPQIGQASYIHGFGQGFEPNTRIIKPETFNYSILSTRFDESQTNNKVRIKSFLNRKKALLENVNLAPFHDVVSKDTPTDNVRLSIDFSVTDALNEDIVNLFATFDYLENAIGNPEYLNSPDYPKLEHMRQIYFQRLTGKINFKDFFEFFKWFDSSIGVFIHQIIPKKTKFLGSNFVVESHILERNKIEYRARMNSKKINHGTVHTVVLNKYENDGSNLHKV